MPQPFNYMIDVPDPTATVMEGVKSGMALRNIRQQKVAERQAVQLNEALGALGPESTIDDYIAVAKFMPPEKAESLISLFNAGNIEQKTNQLQFTQQLLVAASNEPSVAVDMLKKRAEAYRNSGDDKRAQATDAWANIFNTSPEAAIQGASVMLAALGEEGQNALEGVLDQVKTIADIGKLEAETEAIIGKEVREVDFHELSKQHTKATIEKIESDIRKNKLEGEKLRSEIATVGDLEPKDIIKAETDLKKYYSNKTKTLMTSRRQLSIIKAAALDDTGQGDLAIIFPFMKMLDPTSVVRESEYARAAETQGFMKKLLMTGERLQEGKFLKPEERAKFLSLAQKFIKHGEEVGEQEFWLAHDTAEDYGLDPKHIFVEKDLVLYGEKGRPDPEKYTFGREEVADAVAFLNSVNARLDKVKADPNIKLDPNWEPEKIYNQYANPKE